MWCVVDLLLFVACCLLFVVDYLLCGLAYLFFVVVYCLLVLFGVWPMFFNICYI